MIDTLTDNQLKLMEQVRQEWLNRIFKCETKLDKEKVKPLIEWLYESSGLDKPEVIFVESPLGAQYMANVWANVRANVRDNVRDNVWDNVRVNVRNNVGANVGANVRDNVRDNVFTYCDFASYGSISDFGWISFYDFFEKIGLKYQNSAWDKFKKLMESGVYDMVQLDKVCIVCSLPSSIKRQERDNKIGVLHSEETPAIEWLDGYKLWFLDGINFNFELWQKITKKTITAEEVAKIENTEQRMIAFKYLSPNEFIKGSESLVIGLPTTRGNTLYKGSFNETGDIYFLRFKCPSTGREYIEFTNPVRWADNIKKLNGNDIDIYNPDVLQAYSFVFLYGGEKEHLSLNDYLEMTVET